jgi:uncharacterized protein YcfL
MKFKSKSFFMKTVLLLILTSSFGCSLYAQDNDATDNYIITFFLKDSSKIHGYCNIKKNIISYTYPTSTYYSNANFGQNLGSIGYVFYYYDNLGSAKEVLLENIDSVSVEDSSFYFMRLADDKYFWSKVVENDKYILFDIGSRFKIYDKKNEEFLEIKICGHSGDGKMFYKKDMKTFEERIKPYFQDCSGFIEMINENLKEDKYDLIVVGQTGGNKLFKGIANLQCK